MKIIDDLSPHQVRVLGALLEKEQATPEYYPLTVNALIAACNQKSNRDPVTQLTETEVVEAIDSLAKDTLVWRSDGARTERWRQSISRRLELDPEEKAVLTLLMLRGSQTTGELRSRSTRLHAFANLGEVEGALRRLTAEGRELAVELARRPGQKENRWTHLMAGEPGGDDSGKAVSPVVVGEIRSPAGLVDRVAALEMQVAELTAAVERLGSDN
ncbi:MAG: YceH family protein [Acidobacteria bacterium]|nr:YceH family protein [Acidobacteriota bacterium]